MAEIGLRTGHKNISYSPTHLTCSCPTTLDKNSLVPIKQKSRKISDFQLD